jgi:hypothetical protein
MPCREQLMTLPTFSGVSKLKMKSQKLKLLMLVMPILTHHAHPAKKSKQSNIKQQSQLLKQFKVLLTKSERLIRHSIKLTMLKVLPNKP